MNEQKDSLTPGLVAKKGPSKPAAATSYYKALTVKLDRNRYKALKKAGLKLGKKSQQIFVGALDAYLANLD